MTNDRSALISAADLNARLRAGEPIRLVDATFYLPNENKDARALFEQAHIPGAQFFDIDAVSTPSDLPHTAPTPEIFAAAVGAMGITADDTVVVYDQKNMFSAPRGWWTFRLFGHEDVLVLNGGLPAWRAAGYGTADAPTRPERRSTRSAPTCAASGSPTRTTSALHWRRGTASLTPAPGVALPAPTRNPAPACAAAICPARSARHCRACWIRTDSFWRLKSWQMPSPWSTPAPR